MKADSNIAVKIVSTILFLLIITAIILIAQNPAEGYELSVYNAVPFLAWILLITAISGGIGIIVYQTSRGKEEEKWWQVGLLLILLSNLVIVLLPYLRGYAFSDYGDHLSHLGSVKGILQAGSFSADNVYPATHILISQLSSLLNISPERMMNFAGPLFYLLFVLFTYLLSREILPKPAAMLATAASTVLFCYYYIEVFPMGFAFMTFPLVLYLYLKYWKGKSVFGIPLIILIVLMAFFHPVASLTLTIALLIMEASKPLFDRLYIGKRQRAHFSPSWIQQISLNPPLISFIILMLWIWQHYRVWDSTVLSVVSWFRAELLVKPMTERAKEAFETLGLGGIGQLELFIKMYGHHFIYLLLSLIAGIIIARKKLPLVNKDTMGIFLLYCFFMAAVALLLVDYVRPLTSLTSGRMIWLVTALFPPLVGLALFKIGGMEAKGNIESTKEPLHEFSRGKPAKAVGVGLVIAICSLIGIFSIYPSPFTLRPNPAVSYAHMAGENWLLEQGDPSVKAVGLGTGPLYRFADALWGTQERNYPHEDIEDMSEGVGDHFSYDQYETLGESFAGDRYMMSRQEFIEIVYTDLYPQIGRFTEDDFAKLEGDFSVDKLYNNGELQVWYVRGQASAKQQGDK
jgi:hypothetical protein